MFIQIQYFSDLKKLIKYETHSKKIENPAPIRTEPENVINVTIVKQTLPTEAPVDANNTNPKQPSRKVESSPRKIDTETQTIEPNKITCEKRTSRPKSMKKVLQLSKPIKTRNSNVIFKNFNANDDGDGILVRNTPTDLYQKYKRDWDKFKSYIPGENSRQSVRRSVRAKMHQKVDEPPKVWRLRQHFDYIKVQLIYEEFSVFFLAGLRVFW